MSLKKLIHRFNRKDIPLLPRIPHLSKFFFYAFVLVSITLLARSVLAQQGTLLEENLNSMAKGGNQESWLNSALGANLSAITAGLTGEENLRNTLNGTTSYVPGGAFGTTTNLIAALYVPAASGTEYIAQIKNNLLGTKSAYAQGVGFAGLQPLLPIWRGFRNIVYILSSLVFIIIGIMIILRVKTGPQTIVTLQSAVPQIITTLVLVTFSYAIAGLMIDLMNIIQGIVIAVLFTMVQNKPLTENLINSGVQVNDFSFKALSQPHLSTVFNLTYKALPMNALMAISGILGAVIGGLIGFALVGFTAVPGALIGASIGGIGIFLVVIIAILIWQLKFFFGLIKTYINVILKIITAPLHIGMGAIPGSKVGFSNWLSELFAYLSVFPISLLFLVIANVIIDRTQNSPLVSGGNLWTPSILNPGGNLVGFVSGLSGGLVPVALGIGTAFLMSKLPDYIPQFIFQLKPSPWGSAVGEGLKPVGDIASAAAWRAGLGGIRWAGDSARGGKKIQNAWNDTIGKINPNWKMYKSTKIKNAAGVTEEVYRNVAAAKGQKFKD